MRLRHPRNAPGHFYVADGECMACMVPEAVAPDLMGFHDSPELSHCFFARQPRGEAEVRAALDAMHASCCGALRYAGTDRDVLAELKRLGLAAQCDHVAGTP